MLNELKMWTKIRLYSLKEAAWLGSQSWGFECGRPGIKSPTRTTKWIFPRWSQGQIHHVNSRLVCFLPVGILNWDKGRILIWQWKVPLGCHYVFIYLLFIYSLIVMNACICLSTQGYHDIAVTFLLVTGEDLATALLEQLSLHALR